MRASDLAERVPVVTRDTNAAEAARVIAEHRLAGLVIADDDGDPVSVVAGTQVLRLVVPRYVREDPSLAHVYDEAAADELCAGLSKRTVGDLLNDDEVDPRELPVVRPDDTIVEIAALMVAEHSPVVLVRDKQGRSHGVVTLSRTMAAVLAAAGRDTEGVRRTLEEDYGTGEHGS